MPKNLLIEGAIRLTLLDEPVAPVVVLSALYGGVTFTNTGATQMAFTLPADKMIQLKISYQDKAGNPAEIDGVVGWDSSDEEIARATPLAVNPLADNSTVMLVAGTKIGNCQITARGDADLGEGEREIVTLLDVTVVGGEAVSGTIEPSGELIDKPT